MRPRYCTPAYKVRTTVLRPEGRRKRRRVRVLNLESWILCLEVLLYLCSYLCQGHHECAYISTHSDSIGTHSNRDATCAFSVLKHCYICIRI